MSQSTNRTQLNESLSALVDDEASELEVRRILAESEEDAALRERWHRYQLARAATKGEALPLLTTAFADRVRDAIADLEMDAADNTQPAVRATSGSAAPPRWKAGAGRAAIAASVAAAVLLGAQQMNLVAFNGGNGAAEFAQQPAPEPAQTLTPSSITIPTINVQNVSGGDAMLQRNQLPQNLPYSPVTRQEQLQDEMIRRYIRQLMLEHAEHSAQNSSTGLLPFARVPVEEGQ